MEFGSCSGQVWHLQLWETGPEPSDAAKKQNADVPLQAGREVLGPHFHLQLFVSSVLLTNWPHPF